MSLDITLNGPQVQKICECIECGNKHERTIVPIVWETNITHNLVAMAQEVSIYCMVWHPERNGITTAGQLIEPLQRAISLMESDAARFKKHDAKNGWGTYDQFLEWLKEYLAACQKYPTATIEVSR
jgi:hypothetical protein